MNDFIYMASNDKGESYRSIDREEVLEWYEKFNGSYVERYTKDLRPKHEIIINQIGIKISLIRKEEDILNKTSAAMRKAIKKYNSTKTKQVLIRLNKETDNDIIEFLNMYENKQGFIKELIRKEIEKK